MQVGQLYSCKWRCLYEERGWDMLMFLGTESINRSDDIIVTNYRFYDVLTGETRIFDIGLIKHCKEITTEEKCTK